MEDRIIRCVACETDFLWSPELEGSTARPTLCLACRRGLAPVEGRRRGLVKWYSRSKGYGFITPVEGPEVFVHKSGLATGQGALCAGQLVEFSLVSSARGAQAANVEVLHPPEEEQTS